MWESLRRHICDPALRIQDAVRRAPGRNAGREKDVELKGPVLLGGDSGLQCPRQEVRSTSVIKVSSRANFKSPHHHYKLLKVRGHFNTDQGLDLRLTSFFCLRRQEREG